MKTISKPATTQDVSVKLIGADGNVFAIIGTVSQALKRAGFTQEASDFAKKAMSCDSYDAVLQLVMETVTIC